MFVRLYRTFSQSKQGFCPTLLALRKGFTVETGGLVNKDVSPLCVGNGIAAPWVCQGKNILCFITLALSEHCRTRSKNISLRGLSYVPSLRARVW